MTCAFVFLATASLPAQEALSFKLGATLALSGRYAFIGEAERDGLLLGVEQENASGGINGRRLELLIEDNAGETKRAAASAAKLMEIDKVDALFSAFTHITRAVQPLVSRSGGFLIYASSVREMAEENENVFRDYLDIQDDGAIMARHIAAQGFRRIAYMRDESDVCEFHEHSFVREGKPHGVEITAREEFISGESDLRAVLLRLYAKADDAVLFCAWRDAMTVMQQLEQLGLLLKKPLFHCLAPFLPLADSALVRALYERSNTITTWYGFIEGALNPEQQEFVESFKKRFGRYPRPDAAYSYDDVVVLAQGLRACQARPRAANYKCLSRYLFNLRHAGAAGELSFNSSGVSNRPVFLMRIRHGQWVPL